jgi:autotransporter translocation and assembly factor TamB
VSGKLTLGESTISNANVSTVVRYLPVSSEDNFTARIDSAGIVFQGTPQGYTLGGDIVLGESRYTKDLDITQFVGKQSVQRAPQEKPGLLQKTKLNLRIKGSDSLWVDNNLAKLRMHVELGILGTPSNPIPNGQVSIPEGNIFYLDREFQVKEGTFHFSDPNKINPEIHLRAEADVTSYQGMNASTYTITFSAQGLLSELETNLSSVPQLDNSDIIALLTLGTTRTQMTQGSTGGTGAVLEDRAEQLASQRISGALSKKAGKALGLDEVSVTGNLFNFGDSWGPQLVISKSISPRTKITYSTNVGHINDQSFRLSYQLNPKWSLAGETDENGNSSLSIIYDLRFK